MATKTITRNQMIAALKKDLDLILRQHECIEKLVSLKGGQFLNVGNDQWCGGEKEVLSLYQYVINFANRMIKKLSSMKDSNFYPEYIDNHWGTGNFASESNVFLWGRFYKECVHYSLCPNCLKLLG
jgi:hypothetical protein